MSRLLQVLDLPHSAHAQQHLHRALDREDDAVRVAVKDAARNKATLPEDYLPPAVLGGPCKEKRFERAMRYAGVP